MPQFIRVGSHLVNVDHIVSVVENTATTAHNEIFVTVWVKTIDGIAHESKDTNQARNILCFLKNFIVAE